MPTTTHAKKREKGGEGGAHLDVLEDVGDAVLLLALSVHIISIANLRMPKNDRIQLQSAEQCSSSLTWKVFWQNLMAAIFCC